MKQSRVLWGLEESADEGEVDAIECSSMVSKRKES